MISQHPSTLYCLLNNYQNLIIYIRYVITDSSVKYILQKDY